MNQLQRKNLLRRGFTLVEIMIVVAIIALLVALALPSFLRARKRSEATATLEILRVIDHAKAQFATEKVKPETYVPSNADLVPYMKPGSAIYVQMSANYVNDTLGLPIATNAVGSDPQITNASWAEFGTVLDNEASFFAPYGHY